MTELFIGLILLLAIAIWFYNQLVKNHNPPDMTPQLFEKFLPYAIALEVEQLSSIFAQRETEAGKAYRPAWYRGNFSPMHMAGFSKDVSKNFSSAISSTARPTGSRSGGGGGW